MQVVNEKANIDISQQFGDISERKIENRGLFDE